MRIEDAISRLDAIINSLDEELRKASEEFALSAMGMIVNRIQQQGLPGRKYSKNRLPEYWFYDRWLNAGGKTLYEKKTRKKIRDAVRERNQYQLINSTKYKVRANKSIDELEDGITYEEWRKANGLQVDHIDLTFSGRMFQNLGVIGTKRVGTIWVTAVGGSDQEVKMKLEWNTKRFGKFLKPNEQEKKILQDQFKKRIDLFIEKLAA